MYVWVFSWNQFSESEENEEVWATEEEALDRAVEEINRHIKDDWDCSGDETQGEYAQNIQDHIDNSDPDAAIRCWNDYQNNYNEECALRFYVIGKELKGTHSYDDVNDCDTNCDAEACKKVSAMAPAVNDYTCPTCQNTFCSKSERTCWKCGGAL